MTEHTKAEIYVANGKWYYVHPVDTTYFTDEGSICNSLFNFAAGRKEGDMQVLGSTYHFIECGEEDTETELEPITSGSPAQTPRAWTAEEVADKIVTGAVNTAHYWATQPNCGTMEERVSGCAFSILSMLDGSTMNIPGMDLYPQPHPEDKAYCVENGENWFDPETVVSFALHEKYHPKQRELHENYERMRPGPVMNPHQGRETFLRAAVTIANIAGHQPSASQLEACHNTAQGIISLIDGNYNVDLPPFMLFAAPTKELNQRLADNNQPGWDSSIPLNRKAPTYGISEDLGENYESVRRRTKMSALAFCGK